MRGPSLVVLLEQLTYGSKLLRSSTTENCLHGFPFASLSGFAAAERRPQVLQNTSREFVPLLRNTSAFETAHVSSGCQVSDHTGAVA